MTTLWDSVAMLSLGPVVARCNGCSAALTLRSGARGSEMLAQVRSFLDQHEACDQGVSVHLPEQR